MMLVQASQQNVGYPKTTNWSTADNNNHKLQFFYFLKKNTTSPQIRKYTLAASLYWSRAFNISIHHRPHRVAFSWPKDPSFWTC